VFRPHRIRQYLAFMERRGHRAEAVLAGSGLDAAQLRSPGCLVDFHHCQAVAANMIRLSGNQGIGFEVGAEAELTDFGIVGHAMMSSPNAREALGLWLRYSNALVGNLLRLEAGEEEDGSWSLTIQEARPLGFLYNFVVEETLTIGVRMAEALTKVPFVPSCVELTYPAPAHQDLYEAHLKCRPRFHCRHTRITFGTGLDLALRGSDEEFHAICLRHCNQIMRQVVADSPLASRIRSVLLTQAKVPPSFEALADTLGMSPRSLRRHLREEGHSYSDLLNQFRCDLAKEYIGKSNLTAKEAAFLLGFRDTNAFRRAFKSWTGLTIHAFRDAADGGAEHPT
jgi:AraC-like DNA-binding protein